MASDELQYWHAELECGFGVVTGYGNPPQLDEKFVCDSDREEGRKERVVRVWWQSVDASKRKHRKRR